MARSRLIIVVASAGLALTTLAGCRLEAGSAAYVGETSVSQAQVESEVAKLTSDGIGINDSNRARARKLVMGDLLFLAVAKRYAAEKGYHAPAVDYQSASQQYSLPATDPYLRTTAEANTYRQLLLQHSTAVTPTEADFHEIYQRLTKVGFTAPYDQVKAQLQQLDSIGPGLGLRNELAGAVKRYGVRVNPVYGDVEYTLVQVSDNSGQAYSLVALPLGESGGAAVVDAAS